LRALTLKGMVSAEFVVSLLYRRVDGTISYLKGILTDYLNYLENSEKRWAVMIAEIPTNYTNNLDVDAVPPSEMKTIAVSVWETSALPQEEKAKFESHSAAISAMKARDSQQRICPFPLLYL